MRYLGKTHGGDREHVCWHTPRIYWRRRGSIIEWKWTPAARRWHFSMTCFFSEERQGNMSNNTTVSLDSRDMCIIHSYWIIKRTRIYFKREWHVVVCVIPLWLVLMNISYSIPTIKKYTMIIRIGMHFRLKYSHHRTRSEHWSWDLFDIIFAIYSCHEQQKSKCIVVNAVLMPVALYILGIK